jgi:hypothetical protein
VTEQLLLQQLESPSGTGRDEPRSQISLPARTNNKRGCKPTYAFSLADLARDHGPLRLIIDDPIRVRNRQTHLRDPSV